jgi:hypothetical protein
VSDVSAQAGAGLVRRLGLLLFDAVVVGLGALLGAGVFGVEKSAPTRD